MRSWENKLIRYQSSSAVIISTISSDNCFDKERPLRRIMAINYGRSSCIDSATQNSISGEKIQLRCKKKDKEEENAC